MTRISARIFYLLCGLGLIAGGIILNGYGRFHPSTGLDIPDDQYWPAFADLVLQNADWRQLHSGILIGPVLWALGAVGAHQALREKGEERFSALGSTAVAMGAMAWSVAFIFDGFVAVTLSRAVATSGPEGLIAAIGSLQAAEVVVLRLGLVAWILIGLGAAAFAGSLFTAEILSRWLRWALAVSGILVGLWPLLATATGAFIPGPFTSPLWLPTVVLTSVWFSGLGVMLIAQTFNRQDQSQPSPHSLPDKG